MSPHDWLVALPSDLRQVVDLSQLIEPSPDLQPVIAEVETELGVWVAIYDLTRPEPHRPEAHLCRRVQPAALSGPALEVLQAAEAAVADRVAVVAFARPLALGS